MTDRPTPRTDAKTFDPYPRNNNGPGRSYQPEVMYPCDDGSWVDADHSRQLERELAEAHAENLEQARLLGMSAERESDLRGELEREKQRADGLRYELATTREQRDRLAQVIEAATVLIAAKGRHNTFLAYDGLRGALAAVRDSANAESIHPESKH